MSDNVTNLDAARINLNVDALERESSEVRPPFVFGATVPANEARGTEERQVMFRLSDPATVAWDDLAAMDAPVQLLRFVLDPEQREDIIDAAIPAWKFQKIMEAYVKHFGMDLKMGKGQLW